MNAFISNHGQMVNCVRLPSDLVVISTKEVELHFGITKAQRTLEDTEERHFRDGIILDHISTKLLYAAKKKYSVLIRRHSSIQDDTMRLLYKELAKYDFVTMIV